MLKPKFEPRTILFHLEKKIQLYVDSVELVPHKGFLYRLKVLDTIKNRGYKGEWKSYYEDKIEEVCKIQMKPSTLEVLHGKEEA